MNTRTLTFHFPINNGAFLQAYALQNVIKSIGATNEIIDLQTPEQVKDYTIFSKIRGSSDLLKNLFTLLHYFPLKRRKKGFEMMQKNFLDTTKKVQNPIDAINLANESDLNIVGSDQVWNTQINACIPEVYFLQNVNTKKITYATSCGSSVSQDTLNKYCEEIKDFDALGIREQALFNKLDFYDKEKLITIDPTLLLNKEDYLKLYDKNKRKVKGKYIFLYSMRYSDQLLSTVERIAKSLNMKVVVPFTTFKTVKCLKKGFRVVYDASPDVFLNLVEHADLVLTNSFHGTAFSIIFKKDFFHVADKIDGKIKRDDRIDDLLDSLELKRNICVDTDIEFIKNNQNVCYDYVDEKLNIQKQKSVDFLKKHIK